MPTAVEMKQQGLGAHTDMFLKLDGIKGEATDSKHKDEINVLAWRFSAVQPGASAVGGRGAGVGKVQMEDITITKHMDCASPKLFEACAKGQHFPNVVLTCRRAGGKQAEFLNIKMTDVLVSSYHTGLGAYDSRTELSQHGGSFPTDTITLNFSKIVVGYKAQTEGGQEGASVQGGWDLKTNEVTG